MAVDDRNLHLRVAGGETERVHTNDAYIMALDRLNFELDWE